jgi:protein TonB
MLDRHLHQAIVFQASKRDRLATGLVVLAVHGLLALILLADLTATVRYATAEGPAMALLLPDRTARKLPAPLPANVTIPNPRALAPDIVMTPEPPDEAPVPSPAETKPSAILVPPSPAAESALTASSIAGDTGAGSVAEGVASRPAGQAGAGGLDINDYLRQVSLHIQRYIPRGMPRGTPDSGLTYVYLHWMQNGAVVAKRVVQSSGDAWMDSSAILAVTRADRLPPIPPEFRLKEIEGRLPVFFSKR